MPFAISFCDFWEGHDPFNNIITNTIRQHIAPNVQVSTTHDEADIVFVTIYGSNHKRVINNYRDKCILWLGENKRPNDYGCPFSISFDFHNYNNTNFRQPLWYSEIDWYGTGLGVVHIDNVQAELVDRLNLTPDDIIDHEFCITVFNNPEGERVLLYQLLNSYKTVTGFGKPFGNWFPTYNDYKDKIAKLSGYKFNLCPENSYQPGYYTEKCIHSKLAKALPIYKADSFVKNDFRPSSFINLYDYKNAESCFETIKLLDKKPELLVERLNEPLLHFKPNLDEFINFLRYSIGTILI
ncbi:Glycosyltransferase family 10 (fucosyltransferase) [Prochlorococcus marinus str. MIT 1313]|uniref:glycosyltransferase family 10 domain-containing protein n=1 Tax=Prochlorococcus TaxID=1218 RepID=UPI0007B3F8FC|nr:glycosyltransferase family 10 [Prochlorococcus marinus]KZR70250.1 Glycosyltransferase family 10 (fucosyltransferase) [Prochlorococcus marinus str. MIT 1313]KZR70722.1 Glycosyltransferase family 10 (fucosyltransferase) [Prochlorococcus marinus str. MIT 1318]